MNKKILYFGDIVEVLLIYFVLMNVTDVRGPLLDSADANMAIIMYIAQLVIAAFAIFSMWAAFNWLKDKPGYMRKCLTLSADLIVIEHFCQYDTNLLWLLPMIAVVYMTKYKVLISKP